MHQTIKEISKVLEYKDRRSVLRWCRKNDVKIFSLQDCKREYVLKEEFDKAYFKDAIIYAKEKYGSENLSGIIQSSMNLYSELRETLEGKKKNNFLNKKYTPIGEHEISFLGRLTKIIQGL
jgi:hypothetical protein